MLREVITKINSKVLASVEMEDEIWKIDAEGLAYKDLNDLLRTICNNGGKKIEIKNVYGQRYIGTDLESDAKITIYGTPGNDMGAFMNGPFVTVHGNAQDGCGNTMNEGQIIIHGSSGDLTGHSMRGGRIIVRGDVGYRVGIHMKEYQKKKPQIVVGGTAQDFLGEYMAGGVILVLGLNLPEGERCKARFVGTGMHGGVIYERGRILEVGKGTKVMKVGKRDCRMIENLVRQYCDSFDFNFQKVMSNEFHKIVPVSKRPYGKLYSK